MTGVDEFAVALGDRYTIERVLGQGGMAAVYLARDHQHDRLVALKAIHPELTSVLGDDRFRREIRLVAQLHHPHIVPVFDSGEADGRLWFTMPYVEGESLRARLEREGGLPFADIARIARQVGSALDEAHRRGILHRDVKPENILLTPGGDALLSDFGVARPVQRGTGATLTADGFAVGTPLYMSPEQAMGNNVLDGRTDVYALGCVVYELLTGEPPHLGTSVQNMMLKRMTDAPPSARTLRPTIPPAWDVALSRALAVAPADRFTTAGEFAATLIPPVPSGGHGPRAAGRGIRTGRVGLALALALIAALVLGAMLARRYINTPALTTTSAIAVTNAPGVEYQPALSPDGRQVAFVAQRDGRYVLGVRSAVAGSGGEFRPAEATPGAQNQPRWSPDGEYLRFWSCAGGSCSWREVGRLGGAARAVELPRQTLWTAWSRDGARAAFVVNDSIFVYTVADRTTRLLAVHPDPWAQHSLAWSPDGRWIAYVNSNPFWTGNGNTANSSIWIVSTVDRNRTAVTAEDHLNVSPVWLDARHLFFISNRDGPRELYLVEVGPAGPRGTTQKVAGGTDAHSISLSADGRRLAVARMDVRQNVWSYPIRASGSVSIRDGRPVTSGTQVVETHDVSPDGQWLVYDSNLRGNSDIYKVRLDGGEPIPLTTGPTDEFHPRWSPDGREVSFYGGPSTDVFVVSAEGGTPSQLTNQPGRQSYQAWSPDGLRIAFTSDQTGRFEVGLLARERVGGRWREAVQLTDFRCLYPSWAPDGSGLLCSSGTTLVLVSVAGAVQWRRDLTAAGFSQPGAVTFSEDGLSLYLPAARGGRNGIWTWPLAGGEPRLVVAFDDPRFVPATTAGALKVHGEWLYLTVAQNESDIWVMDLKR